MHWLRSAAAAEGRTLLRVLLLRVGVLSTDADRRPRRGGRCFVLYRIKVWPTLLPNPRAIGWVAKAAARWRGGFLTPLSLPLCSCRRLFESSSGPLLSSGWAQRASSMRDNAAVLIAATQDLIIS